MLAINRCKITIDQCDYIDYKKMQSLFAYPILLYFFFFFFFFYFHSI